MGTDRTVNQRQYLHEVAAAAAAAVDDADDEDVD